MFRKCPSCQSGEVEILFEQSFRNSINSFYDGYSVVSCGGCGLVYADNIPSQKDFNDYYESIEKYEFNYLDGTVSSDYGEYFNNVFSFIRRNLGENKSISVLDIGCASGDLLNIFKENGYADLMGVEPSKDSDKKAEDLYGIKVVSNSLQNISLGRKFDLVILSAVLEHIVDVSGMMEEVLEVMKDDGLLFVEVPDIERFDKSIPAPFQQFNMEHVNFFSKGSLSNLMANWGLKVADFSYEDCVADNVVMPDLYMLFKKDGSGNIDVIFDDKSAQSIGNYIEASEKEAALMSDLVDRCLGDVNKLMVWGVGTHTKHLLDAGLDKREVVCFIDSNSRYKGAALNGVEVIMPEMIKGDCPILVSTHSYQDEIMDLIRNKLGLSNEILALYD